MSGLGGLMDFIIATIGLVLVVGLVFLGIEKIAPDEISKKIARWAVGGVALIAFLVALKGVLVGGATMAFGAVDLIEFAVGLLILMVVVAIVYWIIDYFAPPFVAEIKYVFGMIALIALLLIAGKALFGGGLGFFAGIQRHSALMEWQVLALPFYG